MASPNNDPPAFSEQADIDAAEKAHIDQLDAHLDKVTHWELLGLKGKPEAADIKRAYFEASKRYHPDRYYRKELGPYRARLEKIFRAVKAAYDVLSDSARRAQYEASTPPPPDEVVAATPTLPTDPQEREKILEARRQQILDERRQKRMQGAGARIPDDMRRKARELYVAGNEHLDAGQIQNALGTLRLATTYDPSENKYRAALELALGKASENRNDVATAKTHFEAAKRLDPTDGRATSGLERLERRVRRK